MTVSGPGLLAAAQAHCPHQRPVFRPCCMWTGCTLHQYAPGRQGRFPTDLFPWGQPTFPGCSGQSAHNAHGHQRQRFYSSAQRDKYSVPLRTQHQNPWWVFMKKLTPNSEKALTRNKIIIITALIAITVLPIAINIYSTSIIFLLLFW